MTGKRKCIRKKGHSGRHSPDLTGMKFGNLLVVSKDSIKKDQVVWVVRNDVFLQKIVGRSLTDGTTRGINAPHGFQTGGTKTPELLTVGNHRRLISVKSGPNKHSKYYVGMPFYSGWDPAKGGAVWRGAKWIVDNLGKRPGKGWSLDIIEQSKGFVPGNLRWVPRGFIQRRNQVHRKLFDVSEYVFSVEAKRRGYEKVKK
jgi:hypothetical protein